MSWTPESVKILTEMWLANKTAAEIAQVLGDGTTRNAVIGKANRLNLSKIRKKRNEEEQKKRDKEEQKKAKKAKQQAKQNEQNDNVHNDQDDDLDNDLSPEQVLTKIICGNSNLSDMKEEEDDAISEDQDDIIDLPPPDDERPLRPPKEVLQPDPDTVKETAHAAEANIDVRMAEQQSCHPSLMDLTESMCRWPIGDPATSAFWFCGLPIDRGSSYCKAHTGVALQSSSMLRRERR